MYTFPLASLYYVVDILYCIAFIPIRFRLFFGDLDFFFRLCLIGESFFKSGLAGSFSLVVTIVHRWITVSNTCSGFFDGIDIFFVNLSFDVLTKDRQRWPNRCWVNCCKSAALYWAGLAVSVFFGTEIFDASVSLIAGMHGIPIEIYASLVRSLRRPTISNRGSCYVL